MKSLKYVATGVAAFTLALAAYAWLIDDVLIGRQLVPSHPNQLLVNATADITGKVVIVGGSSSDIGLNPVKLSRTLKRLVVNVAINGDVPLEQYLYLVDGSLRRGDTLFLPLEWAYYVRGPKARIAYVVDVLGKHGAMTAMFAALPLRERLRHFYTDMPVSMVVRELLDRIMNGDERLSRASRRLIRLREYREQPFETRLGMEPDYGALARVKRQREHESGIDCDEHLYGVDEPRKLRLNAVFEKRLKWMRDHLVSRGVQVVFAWPLVINTESGSCYDGAWRPAVERLAGQIRAQLNRYGFEIVGDWKSWRYEPRCRRDTPYHLTRKCANRHTKRLADALLAAGLKRGEQKISPARVTKLLDREYQRIGRAAAGRLEPLTETPRARGAVPSIVPADGWSGWEPWGIWSDGKRSVLLVRVTAGTQGIHLSGRYYGPPEDTRIRVNGVDAGRFDLRDARIPLLDAEGGGVLRIELFHDQPVFPKEERGSASPRQIKYGLEEVWAIRNLLSPLPPSVKAKKLPRYALFARGWSKPKPWGLWSTGQISVFYLRVSENHAAIAIEGKYSGGLEQTLVRINGRFAGRYDLRNAVICLDEADRAGLVRVELHHEMPLVPDDHDSGSSDVRNIKYGMTKLGALARCPAPGQM